MNGIIFTVGSILLFIITLLSIALTVRIILSWLTLPPSKWLLKFYSLTDPVLDFFRKNFPLRLGLLDLSILIPIVILFIAGKLVNDLMLVGVAFTPIYLVIILLDIVRMTINFITGVIFFFTLILIVVNLTMPNHYNPLITGLRSFIDPYALKLRRLLKLRNKHADVIYLGLIALIALVIGILLYYAVTFLMFELHQLNNRH